MTKMLFAAGDVGGARALLPVARLAHSDGHQIAAMAHRDLHIEGDKHWIWYEFESMMKKEFWQKNNIDVIFYATSVAEFHALQVARFGAQMGSKTIHVLDNWSNYAARLQDGENSIFEPDIYSVMDELALNDALLDGVPSSILQISGHPNLAHLADLQFKEQFSHKSRQSRSILFVSEPVSSDDSLLPTAKRRGYTEIQVARIVAAAIDNLGFDVDVKIAVHPREERQEVSKYWRQLMSSNTIRHANKNFELVPQDQTSEALKQADTVIGMASILLYEAYLLGKTVVSVQPGLQRPDLRALQHRKGIYFLDNNSQIAESLSAILRCASSTSSALRPDVTLHQHAAQTLLDMAGQLVAAEK